MNTTALNNFIISNQMYCNYFNNSANCSAIYSSKNTGAIFLFATGNWCCKWSFNILFIWETTSSMLSISEI